MTTLLNTEDRIRIREEDWNDAHVRVSIFVGQPGQGGHAGQLCFRLDEYPDFRRRIEHFAPIVLAGRRLALEAGRRLQAPLEYWEALEAFWKAIADSEK